MLGLFKKKTVNLLPVMEGEVVPITEVPDQAFSEKMLGDGYAVKPVDGTVKAPVAGRIVQIFPTNHAFGILAEKGLEILVHIGIDTVELKGEGFRRLAEPGQEVQAGTPVMEVDLEVLRLRGKESITPVVVTNMHLVKGLKVHGGPTPEVAAEIELK
ncbi:PTS sugar transporter subunit IIA [Anaerotalea alkaliphila]|nr:PTS glucose transporter subunit IIA [Anaerotalea alkaliphila]